ncbi:MAG: hypothetical protein QNK11_05180, partial [Legionella sp.]|nr:hypothetical protein [Legionella sp.]
TKQDLLELFLAKATYLNIRNQFNACPLMAFFEDKLIQDDEKQDFLNALICSNIISNQIVLSSDVESQISMGAYLLLIMAKTKYLRTAIKIACMEALLGQAVSAETQDEENDGILHFAILSQDIELVTFLLKSSFKEIFLNLINNKGLCVILTTFQTGNSELINMLLAHSSSDDINYWANPEQHDVFNLALTQLQDNQALTDEQKEEALEGLMIFFSNMLLQDDASINDKSNWSKLLEYLKAFKTLHFNVEPIASAAATDSEIVGAGSLSLFNSSSRAAYTFSRSQINQLKKHKTWNIVTQDSASLESLGFTADHVSKIAGHSHGAESIKVVLNKSTGLKRKGFNNREIAKIAGHPKGANNIQMLLKRWSELRKFHFNCDQISKISGQYDGAQNIIDVLKNKVDLSQKGFSHDQIAKLASNSSAGKNIEFIIEKWNFLMEHDFKLDEICRIVGHGGGYLNLKAVVDNKDKLDRMSLNNKQISMISGDVGGSHNIHALIKYNAKLRAFQFSLAQIIEIAGHPGASKAIERIVEYWPTLKKAGYSHAQVVTMTTGRTAGSLMIERVVAKVSEEDETQNVNILRT